MWLLRTLNMVNVTDELNFKFNLNVNYLNGHMWLVATILDSEVLRFTG